MRLPLYHLDAFASRLFAGNPAAVVPLETWLPDPVMQAIATEMNLSETAFVCRERRDWRLRWFTPSLEVDLCGHATLATAWVLFRHYAIDTNRVDFATRSGLLTVRRENQRLVLDFPALPPVPCAAPSGLATALGVAPREVLVARALVVVLDTAEQVRALAPDMAALAALDASAVMVTAPGDTDCDFVSRFFAPAEGIAEDPVTGSAHCTLAPFWSRRLGRKDLVAHQLSRRGGELHCSDLGERVEIAGRVVPFLEGAITI